MTKCVKIKNSDFKSLHNIEELESSGILILNQQVDGSIPPAGSKGIQGVTVWAVALFLSQAVSRTNSVKPGTNLTALPASRPEYPSTGGAFDSS